MLSVDREMVNGMNLFGIDKRYFESFDLDKLEKDLEDANLCIDDYSCIENYDFLDDVYILEIIDHLPETVRNSCMNYLNVIDTNFNDIENNLWNSNMSYIKARGINYMNCPELEDDYKDASWVTSDMCY